MLFLNILMIITIMFSFYAKSLIYLTSMTYSKKWKYIEKIEYTIKNNLKKSL